MLTADAFLQARSAAEAQLASTLTSNTTSSRKGALHATPLQSVGPHWTPGTGFNADDGASLLLAFRGLQAESVAQGQAHRSIARELTTLVADPFEEWSEDYKVPVTRHRYHRHSNVLQDPCSPEQEPYDRYMVQSL